MTCSSRCRMLDCDGARAVSGVRRARRHAQSCALTLALCRRRRGRGRGRGRARRGGARTGAARGGGRAPAQGKEPYAGEQHERDQDDLERAGDLGHLPLDRQFGARVERKPWRGLLAMDVPALTSHARHWTHRRTHSGSRRGSGTRRRGISAREVSERVQATQDRVHDRLGARASACPRRHVFERGLIAVAEDRDIARAERVRRSRAGLSASARQLHLRRQTGGAGLAEQRERPRERGARRRRRRGRARRRRTGRRARVRRRRRCRRAGSARPRRPSRCRASAGPPSCSTRPS